MTMTEKKTSGDDNTVFVGRKDLMSYVLAVVTQFNEGGVDEVVIKARGRAISRAVDTAEISRQRFLPDVLVKDVRLGTEQIEGEKGPVRVSSMEITLGR
jgi:DNA-binding protein